VERLPAARRSVAGAIPRALTASRAGDRRSAASFAREKSELRRSAGRLARARKGNIAKCFRSAGIAASLRNISSRLAKTFDSNRLAVTFTIAEINTGKTARHDLVLKLEILRIGLSLLELRELLQ
jgi:hypothetical protein